MQNKTKKIKKTPKQKAKERKGLKKDFQQIPFVYHKWIESFDDVSDWFNKYDDLEYMLEENDGIVKISNFLPDYVAKGMLALLKNNEDWQKTQADENFTHNNIQHEFTSSRDAPGLEQVFRVLSMLYDPSALFQMSAGKYEQTNHIKPHDDKAYTDVQLFDEDEEPDKIVTCSRDIAIIYYLTEDWKESDGGLLIDLQDNKTYVPEFNSVICFKVPRMHEVTPVLVPKARYSIYGWFLQEGKLYELDDQKCEDQQEDQQEEEPKVQTKNARRNKK